MGKSLGFFYFWCEIINLLSEVLMTVQVLLLSVFVGTFFFVEAFFLWTLKGNTFPLFWKISWSLRPVAGQLAQISAISLFERYVRNSLKIERNVREFIRLKIERKASYIYISDIRFFFFLFFFRFFGLWPKKSGKKYMAGLWAKCLNVERN